MRFGDLGEFVTHKIDMALSRQRVRAGAGDFALGEVGGRHLCVLGGLFEFEGDGHEALRLAGEFFVHECSVGLWYNAAFSGRAGDYATRLHIKAVSNSSPVSSMW